MVFFRRRPLCFICMIFLSSSALAYVLPFAGKAIFVQASLIAAVIAAIFARKDRGALILLFLSIILACILSYLTFELPEKKYFSLIDQKSHVIEGKIGETIYYEAYGCCFYANITRVDGKDVSFGIILSVNFPFDPAEGYEFAADAVLAQFEENIDSFPQKSYYYSRGYLMSGECDGNLIILSDKPAEKSIFDKISLNLNAKFYNSLDAESAAFTNAVLLGDVSELSLELKRDFRALGISHLFSVSGLHLTIFVGAMGLFLSSFPINRKIKYAILIVMTFLFMGIVGFTPSVVRSGVMVIIFQLAFIFGRTNDSLTALLAGASMICIVNPRTIIDIGFLLSFFSTAGIIILGVFLCRKINLLLYRIPKAFRGILGFILSSVSITVSASFFILPVSALSFGEISVTSIIGNIIFIPILSIILYLAFVFIITSSIPYIGVIIAYSISLLCSVITSLSSYLGPRIGYTISLLYPFALPIIISCAGVFLFIFLFINTKKGYALIAPFIACAVLYMICIGVYGKINDGLSILVVSNIKSNETIILSSGGQCHVIDISDGASRHMNRSLYISSLLYHTRITSYTLTHYHSRQVSTFDKLSKNQYLSFLLLPEPSDEKEENICNSLIELAEEQNVSVIFYTYENPLAFDGASITFFPPSFIKRSVQPMISIKFSFMSGELLYSSAVMHENENTAGLLSEYSGGCEYIVYGVHGPLVKRKYLLGVDGENFLCGETIEELAEGEYTVIDGTREFAFKAN